MGYELRCHFWWLLSVAGIASRSDSLPENVLRGRKVPRERLLAVAEHYYHFGGKSPINQQIRDLISALEAEGGQHSVSYGLCDFGL